jgi:hypothetical protein
MAVLIIYFFLASYLLYAINVYNRPKRGSAARHDDGSSYSCWPQISIYGTPFLQQTTLNDLLHTNANNIKIWGAEIMED